MGSVTDRFRTVFVLLFLLAVLVSLAGWLQGRDPSTLAPVLGWLTAAVGIGEGANIGKRATWKQEAFDAETPDA